MRYIILFTIFLSSTFGFSNRSVAEIYIQLQKMHSLKRVLYIAAHPDDENTRALAWLSLGEKAETAYLSLTRGDGGQNLIGNELDEDLGVLRTQELLAARSYDGAVQFFTRAVDFGFSKSPEESFQKWGKENLLADVVLVIRQFRPDVIITRFPPDERAGHGHHTASAVLAIEAFDKAADPTYLPDQVKKYGVWKTTSLYWNASNWWNKEIEKEAKDNPDFILADIGGYNPILGQSYNEIGTIARSQHKCQGFGAVIERGERLEYFQYVKGEKLVGSLFEKNTQSWKSLVSQKFSDEFDLLLTHFDFVNPEKNIPALLKVKKGFESLPNSSFRAEKLAICDQLILDCLGLYVELVGDDYAFVKDENLALAFNFVNRSKVPLVIDQITFGDSTRLLNKALPLNAVFTEKVIVKTNYEISNPYWLRNPFNTMFDVTDENDLGKAEGSPVIEEDAIIQINGVSLTIKLSAEYKWQDPSYGERRRDMISAPDFTVNFDQNLAILKAGQEKKIRLTVHSFKNKLSDEIQINAPMGWEVYPAVIPVNIDKKHGEASFEIALKSTEKGTRGELNLANKNGNKLFSYTEIAYDHIPTQVIFKSIDFSCIKLDATIQQGNVLYIKGAGDEVPQAIEQLGFDLKIIEVQDLASIDLSVYQSIVLGIRIYNVHPELKNFDQKLFNYINEGGNLVMQYNTASRNATPEKFGPTSFEISRDRITEEDAKVTFLAPEHPVLNFPNKISEKDFDGWVQERGLYFASNWDASYTKIISWNDLGEKPLDGALIVTNYGKGRFIYTGISFFRELPSGVEGAYRLFANLLSYQK